MTKSNSFQYLIKNICWYFSRIFVTLSCEVFLLNKRNKRFYQVKLNAPLREFVLTVPWFNLLIEMNFRNISHICLFKRDSWSIFTKTTRNHQKPYSITCNQPKSLYTLALLKLLKYFKKHTRKIRTFLYDTQNPPSHPF